MPFCRTKKAPWYGHKSDKSNKLKRMFIIACMLSLNVVSGCSSTLNPIGDVHPQTTQKFSKKRQVIGNELILSGAYIEDKKAKAKYEEQIAKRKEAEGNGRRSEPGILTTLIEQKKYEVAVQDAVAKGEPAPTPPVSQEQMEAQDLDI